MVERVIVSSNRYDEHMTCGDTWMDYEDGQHECGLPINHQGCCACGKCGVVRLQRRADPYAVTFNHDIPETHREGYLSVENLEKIQAMNLQDCDLGFQVSYEGRVWICVNGVAFLRFKPTKKTDD